MLETRTIALCSHDQAGDRVAICRTRRVSGGGRPRGNHPRVAARQRKALYQEEHPETKRGSGGGRAKAGKGAKSQNATEQTPAFIDAHAKQTGRHRATT